MVSVIEQIVKKEKVFHQNPLELRIATGDSFDIDSDFPEIEMGTQISLVGENHFVVCEGVTNERLIRIITTDRIVKVCMHSTDLTVRH